MARRKKAVRKKRVARKRAKKRAARKRPARVKRVKRIPRRRAPARGPGAPTPKGLKKCPECKTSHFFEDEARGERVCARCGLVLEDSMVDASPEWRAFDDEQRSKRTRAGAPLTFSVDAEEPIMIKEGDEAKVVKIGEFVDKIIKSNKMKKQGNLEVVFLPNSNISVASFDKRYNIGFEKVTEVSRHPVKELFELDLESGKVVRVTGAHSVFTVKNGEVASIKVADLKVGDFLVAPKKLPSGTRELRLDLIKEFAGYKNVYLRGVAHSRVFEYLKTEGVPAKQLKNWKRHRTLPLSVFDEVNIDFKPNGERIGTYSSPVELPTSIEIDEGLCRLLGYYVAEGSCDAHTVRFAFGSHEKEYIDEVRKLLKMLFGMKAPVYTHDTTTTIEVNSKLLAILFSDILRAGKRAKEKRIPPIIFSLPKKMKLAFVHGYINGDGHVWMKKTHERPDAQVDATSASKDLMEDLLMLYLQLGVHANYAQAEIKSHTIGKTGQVLPDNVANFVRTTNPDLAVKLGFVKPLPKRKRKGAIEELIPAPLEYRKEWKGRKRIRIGRELAIKIAKKHGDKRLLKLAQSPFIFLRVRGIRKVKPSNGYAYDLTVPGCENFTGKIFYHNTKHDKGLTTEIGRGKGELFRVTPTKRAQYHRLKIWQKRLVESKDRNLSFALSELQRLISFLGLPKSVHEEVAKKYEQAVDRGLVRGRSMESVIASLLYAVTREMGTPRTLEEIAEASGVERREIGRTYRYIARELKVRILPAPPQDYVPRFASMLGLSDKVQARAIQFLREAKKNEVTSGKGPTGVAAAALYIAAVLEGEKRTQREIADAIGVTEVTIRNRFKELVEKLGIEEEVEKKVREES